MEENALSTSLFESIRDNVLPPLADFAESGLDAITEDETLKSIPVISTVISVFKIGKSIKERFTLKKFAAFLEEIRNETCDEEKREKYYRKFQDNKRERNKELEYLLILIDRYLSTDKAIMLAKLYLAFLDDTIMWQELASYAEILDRILPIDYGVLVSDTQRTITIRNNVADQVLRLVSLGLFCEDSNGSPFVEYGDGGFAVTDFSMQQAINKERTYKRTEFGEKLANILR